MKIKLSEKGPEVSKIIAGVMSWGVWGSNLDPQAMLGLINHYIDLGVNTFDHADIYGHYTTEEAFGNALKLDSSLRSKMKLITKCGINLTTPNRPQFKIKSYSTDKEHILKSVDKSLENFNSDYIDVLLIHRPSPLMNPHEIAEAFSTLKESGKVLFFGVSNFTASQFDVLNSCIELCTNQVEASILHLNPFLDGTFDTCLKNKIVPTIWSPLAGGKVFKEADDRVARILKVVKGLESKYDLHLDQILLSWLMTHPAKLVPVIGTVNKGRISNAVAAAKVKLENEDWFKIWEASTGTEVP